MAFGGDGDSVVVSGSFDATVRLWDCKSQNVKPIQVLEEARDSVSAVWVGGHEVVTGSVDGRMRVYDLRMGMVFIDVVGRKRHPIRCFRFHPLWGHNADATHVTEQNPSPQLNKPETAMQSWYPRWTRRSG